MAKRMLLWASAIMITLGAGHLVLLTVLAREDIARWVDQGVWAAVPLMGGSPRDNVTFWSGVGSFAVPMVLLGCLLWRLAGRGVAVPAWLGWGLLAWWTLGGVLLVPSPFVVGIVPSVLIVLAARADRRQALR